jgi:hypothetical protein
MNSISDFGRAPIKGEGMISDPDEYEWKCGCAKCEERYRHWKNDFDVQQAALREEGKWGASAVMNPDYVAAQKEKARQALDVMAENARELGLDYEPVPENFIDALKFDVAMRDAAPVQEPLAWKPEDYGYPKTYEPPAAQRQWVGLTDDERVDLWKATETDNRMVLIDAIEAKLKEKNT